MGDWLWQLDGAVLGRGASPRLDHVTLTIRPGITAVLGYSGAGKTSLLNLLVGYEKPDRGQVTTHAAVKTAGLPMYWVPQDDGLWPHLAAGQHLAKVTPGGERHRLIAELAAALDLGEVLNAHPERLSRGERSRLSVARALASGAAVLVMDEPLAHVDPTRQDRYWDVMIDLLRRRGISLVFATHQPRVVLAHAQRAVVMRGGRVLGEGAVDELYWRPATPELAESLGDGNWLEPAEAAQWLGAEWARGLCVRPERLDVAESDHGLLQVLTTRSLGAVTETVFTQGGAGQPRRFVHRTPTRPLPVGARVALRAAVEGAPHS